MSVWRDMARDAGMEPLDEAAAWIEEGERARWEREVGDLAQIDSANVDRPAFLAKVREAVAAVDALDVGHFRLPVDWGFADAKTRDLIAAGMPHRIVGAQGSWSSYGGYRCTVYAWVAMDDFYAYLPPRERYLFAHRPGLEGYREWLRALLEFAEDLQDPAFDFYCSN